MSTEDIEVRALLRARADAVAGRRYICLSIGEALPLVQHNALVRALCEEVLSFVGGDASVEAHMDVSPEMAQTYRIAIIDTMLARRGVKCPVGGARGKEEVNRTIVVSAETLKALRGSIVKWEKAVLFYSGEEGGKTPRGAMDCPLCLKYNKGWLGTGDGCDGCPVREVTGLNWCHGTPYAVDASEGYSSLQRAQDELRFLQDVLRMCRVEV